MVHLRIVVPSHNAGHALDLLRESPSVINIIYLERAAHKPEGDVILCDVAREDASVIISDLREFGIDEEGSIAIELIDSEISKAADEAIEAAKGMAGDAVVWEEVEARTSESVELSANFLIFMVLACLLASISIMLDSPILIVGAMVLGPEFGPLAGLCVAAVQRRGELAKRSAIALLLGFPVAILASYLFAEMIAAVDLTPDGFESGVHPFTDFISEPDWFSFFVAYLAGTAGVLSLTSTKSGALVGVLISVATIPAAANMAVAAAYSNWDELGGAATQLALNLGTIVLAGIVTLFVQRKLYQRRRLAHLHDESRAGAGLPVGSSRRDKLAAERAKSAET